MKNHDLVRELQHEGYWCEMGTDQSISVLGHGTNEFPMAVWISELFAQGTLRARVMASSHGDEPVRKQVVARLLEAQAKGERETGDLAPALLPKGFHMGIVLREESGLGAFMLSINAIICLEQTFSGFPQSFDLMAV